MSFRNHIQQVLLSFYVTLKLFVVPYNNLAFITKYPLALWPELSNISSHDTILHVLFYSCDFRLCKPPYIFLFSTIFAQNWWFLSSLITPVICTHDFILWSLKINIPLRKQSHPVGLFPVDVLNLSVFFKCYFIRWNSLIYKTPFRVLGWFFHAVLDFNAQLYHYDQFYNTYVSL